MKKLILAFVLSLFSSISMAHPGHGLESAYAGFMHPLTGIDHLLVMLAVGVLAAKSTDAMRWQLPAVFVCSMALGALFGAGLNSVIGLELLIAVSVIIMGILVSARFRLNQWLQFSITAVLALFHGLAHGMELQLHSQWLGLASMVFVTALLHAAGYWFGLQRNAVFARLQQVFAMVMVLIGASLLVV